MLNSPRSPSLTWSTALPHASQPTGTYRRSKSDVFPDALLRCPWRYKPDPIVFFICLSKVHCIQDIISSRALGLVTECAREGILHTRSRPSPLHSLYFNLTIFLSEHCCCLTDNAWAGSRGVDIVDLCIQDTLSS